tara:strand:- start:186 stop:431 length:246 start_codon:yes stop_codon:yes gene_type:complete
MCFPQPKTPQVRSMPALPPMKPVQEAETGKGPARTELRDEKKQVAYGAKSLRKLSSRKKTDSASLMVPLNKPNNSSGGINV